VGIAFFIVIGFYLQVIMKRRKKETTKLPTKQFSLLPC